MPTTTGLNAIARCDREIAAAEAEIRAGGEPLQVLLLWLRDWCAEKRLIEKGEVNK